MVGYTPIQQGAANIASVNEPAAVVFLPRSRKVMIKVYSPDGKTSKARAYHPAQLASALKETAENLEKWFKGKKYERVAVAGGYNFVCRGSR